MRELALFAGAGGGILGGRLLGWRTVCAVELDPYARRVLLARQRDGHLDRFPIWDDIRTFDGRPWRGTDVVSGGFPCTDISCAGKGAGIEGDESGLWVEMARIIREVRPRHVYVENSPMLTSRGLGVVLGDLAEMGMRIKWGVVGAHHAGAPHKRDRIWIVATDPDRHPLRDEEQRAAGRRIDVPNRRIAEPRHDGASWDVADAERSRLEGHGTDAREPKEPRSGGDGSQVADTACVYAQRRHNGQGEGQPGGGCWWEVEPDVGRVAHGVADRVDRLRAIGNGQVPAVAALAWRLLGG
jgi:DNA (cytosine-5)-methyltransferase 1